MKTLSTIQLFSKVGRILCKIVFILSLVGGIGCAVGILSLAVIPEGFQVGGVTIKGLIEENANTSVASLYASMISGMILCAGEAVLSRFAEAFFANELKAGTPFTQAGAKEMIRLGILTICIPVAANVLSAIAISIVKLIAHESFSARFDIFTSGSVGLGLTFIISSLLCRYGAELEADKNEPETENGPLNPESGNPEDPHEPKETESDFQS